MQAHEIRDKCKSILRRLSVCRRKKIGDPSVFFTPIVTLWFLVRVLPKPSRITYPCQRATLSMFLIKTGIITSTLIASTSSLIHRKTVKILSMSILIGAVLVEPMSVMYYQHRYHSANPNLWTLQQMIFEFPSNRVVRVHSDDLTSWDFDTGYYWEYADQSAIDHMVEEGVKALTDSADAQSAWEKIMTGYASGDKVGIKINGNDWWNSNDAEIDSLPQLTNAIIRGLKSIGVPEIDIYIIENTYTALGFRTIRPYYTNIITTLYPDVVFQYDTYTDPTYGTVPGSIVDFPYRSSLHINDQIASVDHLILVPIMKAITPLWGITGTIKLMQGVIEQVNALHGELARTTADNPDVLIYQNQHIIGKTRLIVGDGVFGAWTGQHFTGGYGGTDYLNSPVDDIPKPWITFNNEAPNCLFFGVDPVATDSVMYDHILRERNAQDQVSGQTLAPFNDPQLIAGQNAGLGIREHGPPYTNIDYVELEYTYPISTRAVRTWYWVDSTTIQSVVAADVDGDEDVEIVSGGCYYDGIRNHAQLCVWDSVSLSVERVTTWYWVSNTTIESIAVGNVDGDADIEIVTGGTYYDGTRLCAQLAVWDGSSLALEGVKAWFWSDDTSIYSVAVGDVDGDEDVEIVSGGCYYDGIRECAQLCVWDGSSLNLEDVQSWFWVGDTGVYSVALRDVDGDGQAEIVTGGFYYDDARECAQLAVWDGSSLALEGVKAWFWSDDTSIYSVAVGDVDGDGQAEIVTGGFYDYYAWAQLAVWDGTTLNLEGVTCWHWVLYNNIHSLALADVDSDGSAEIVAGGLHHDGTCQNAQLTIWDGSTLALEDCRTWYWVNHTSIKSVSIIDIGGDDQVEIVTGGCFFDNTRYNAQLTIWENA